MGLRLGCAGPPLSGRIPQLGLAVDEIFARHAAIRRGEADVKQLSLSCLHAWLLAAADQRLLGATPETYLPRSIFELR